MKFLRLVFSACCNKTRVHTLKTENRHHISLFHKSAQLQCTLTSECGNKRGTCQIVGSSNQHPREGSTFLQGLKLEMITNVFTGEMSLGTCLSFSGISVTSVNVSDSSFGPWYGCKIVPNGTFSGPSQITWWFAFVLRKSGNQILTSIFELTTRQIGRKPTLSNLAPPLANAIG